MTVRRAAREDISALCALERECFSEPWSERGFEDFFALDYTAAFAALDEPDGRVIGYAGMYLSGGDGDITNIAVTGAFRRRGVGSALIDALKDFPGVERLLLEVRESNRAARALYEKLGFSVDGVRKNFYSSPRENAVLMSLEIKRGQKC